MSVRRRAARHWVPSARQVPTRSRTGLFAMITLGAGAVSGIAALLGVPPFGNFQALLNQFLHADAPPQAIAAQTLFPPVPPVHRVVDVYDPAPAAPAPKPAPAPQPPAAAPTPRPHASPTPPVHSTPSPTPPND